MQLKESRLIKGVCQHGPGPEVGAGTFAKGTAAAWRDWCSDRGNFALAKRSCNRWALQDTDVPHGFTSHPRVGRSRPSLLLVHENCAFFRGSGRWSRLSNVSRTPTSEDHASNCSESPAVLAPQSTERQAAPQFHHQGRRGALGTPTRKQAPGPRHFRTAPRSPREQAKR